MGQYIARETLCAVVLGLLCVLSLSTSLPSVGAKAPTQAAPADTEPVRHQHLVDSPARLSQVRQANNTTVRHRKPDTVREAGDTRGLERYLFTTLNERLRGSTVDLSQREYERARELLGDDYNESLEKLVDVAGETGNRQTAAQFAQARADQRAYITDVSRFRETYEAYQEARRAGNEQRARRLARELARLAQATTRTGTNLQETYTAIENSTRVSTDRQRATIEDTTNNITRTQRRIEAFEFEPTNLTVGTNSTVGSYTAPFVVSGRLTANGSGVAGATIVLAQQPRVRTQTNDSGRFKLRYRPTTIPVETESLRFRYVPPETSEYLATNTTVSVDIEQVTATGAITTSPSSVSYGDAVGSTVTVEVADERVTRYPLVMRVGGRTLARGRTNESGIATVDPSLPATVPAGNATLTVTSGRTDAAVALRPTSVSLTVESTETVIELSLRQVSQGIVRVQGRFRTTAGQPITGRTLTLSTNSSRETVQTTARGDFEHRLQVPDGFSGTFSVRAAYDGTGGNLQGATVERRIEISPPARTATVSQSSASPARRSSAAQSPSTGDSQPTLGAVLTQNPLRSGLIGALVVFGVVLSYVWLRRRSRTDTAQPPVREPTVPANQTTEPSADLGLFEDAKAALDAGATDRAVQLTFAALRRQLYAHHDLPGTLTHWELFNEVLTEFSPEEQSALEEIFGQYERAMYGRSAIEREAADEALTLAKDLITASDAASPSDS